MKDRAYLNTARLQAALRSSKQGFTIIEVMIVLAIAGLILLIVFLAVPALQRNSRNTQYREDAGHLLAALPEFLSTHSNNMPATNADGTTMVGLANSKNITAVNVVNPGTTTAVTPTLSTATLEVGVQCGASGGTSITPASGGPARGAILIYGVEKSSGSIAAQCTAS